MKSNKNTDKSKMGRPPVDTEAVNVRLPRDMLEALDEFRREQHDIPTRPEAVRRLMKEQLIALQLIDWQEADEGSD